MRITRLGQDPMVGTGRGIDPSLLAEAEAAEDSANAGTSAIVVTAPGGSLSVQPVVSFPEADIGVSPDIGFDFPQPGEIAPPANGNGLVNGAPDPTEAGIRSFLGLDDPDSFLVKYKTPIMIGGGVAAAGLILYLAMRK